MFSKGKQNKTSLNTNTHPQKEKSTLPTLKRNIITILAYKKTFLNPLLVYVYNTHV